MTDKFYKKHTSAWFAGKKARALCDIRNNGGHTILAGEVCCINGKTSKGGFILIGPESGAYIVGVSPSDIELLPNE